MYIQTLKPHTLAVFELGIFCSVGGRDDDYAAPPGLCKLNLVFAFFNVDIFVISSLHPRGEWNPRTSDCQVDVMSTATERNNHNCTISVRLLVQLQMYSRMNNP
jgi:hypothetical protein